MCFWECVLYCSSPLLVSPVNAETAFYVFFAAVTAVSYRSTVVISIYFCSVFSAGTPYPLNVNSPHPQVLGRLGCLHLWAVVSNAAMNAGVHTYVQVPAFHFSRTPMLFSVAAAPFYIPASRAGGLRFLHVLDNTCYFLRGDNSPPSGCEVVSSYFFD